jgi:hypothetical protein
MDIAAPPDLDESVNCRLDAGVVSGEHRAMDEDDLDPRELERIRRRDHDAGGEDRELLKPGMGKVFKQILDRQGRVARDAREAGEAPRTRTREVRRRAP